MELEDYNILLAIDEGAESEQQNESDEIEGD